MLSGWTRAAKTRLIGAGLAFSLILAAGAAPALRRTGSSRISGSSKRARAMSGVFAPTFCPMSGA